MSDHDLVVKYERISQLSTVWPDIFYHTPYSSPFLSYDWFYALCRNLLRADPEVMAFLEDDRIVGIIPGKIEEGFLRLIGDERVTDLNGIIYLPGYEHRIIRKLASIIRAKDLRIDLFPLEAKSPIILLLPEFLSGVDIERADPCPILPLPDSCERWLNNLTAKSRHELKRKLKKVVDAEIKELGPQQIELLFKLMIASNRNKKDFLKTEVCEFFRAIASSFFKNGWLRLRATFLNSQPLGIIFSFHFRDRIYLYNTGFNPDFKHLAPGIITIAMDIRSAINSGVKYYDFLRGAEKYKFSLGAKKHYTMRIRR